MGEYVIDFESWDICDQIRSTLFIRIEFGYKKAVEWSSRKEEFVKRSIFVLIETFPCTTKDKQ